MDCLRDLSLEELTLLVARLGHGPARARRLFRALHLTDAAHARDLDGVAPDLLRRLDDGGFVLDPLTLHQVSVSRRDPGTEKYLFVARDGSPVETVLMRGEDGRVTLCLSSQVGCRMGCAFCRTGGMGLVRSLSAGEMASQVTKVRARLDRRSGPPLRNVVFMGMGEPFDNFEAVMRAHDLLNHPLTHNLSRDRITLSTCGHVDGIDALARLGLRTNLAVSLNAPTDELRSRLMPVNRRWPLGELLAALRRFPLRPGRVIVIEYVLIASVNDGPEHLGALRELLGSLPVKVNVIAYNEVPGLPFRAPTPDRTLAFARALEGLGHGSLVRRSRGQDVQAACGQLGARPLLTHP